MKRFLVIAVVWAAVGLGAPLPSSAARVEAGVKFGFNIAVLLGPDVYSYPGYDSNWLLRFGLCGGGYVALPLSQNVAIQTEALITTKGSHEIKPLFSEYETYLYSLKITYFEVPVLVRFSTRPTRGNAQLVFMTGPALGLRLGSRLLRDKEVMASSGVKSSDLGLVFSVGYSITRKKSKGYADFRWTAGLSNIIEREGVPLRVRNGVFSLIVGVRL